MQRMFSSTNNIINPFALFPSSSYHPPLPPLITSHDHSNEIFLQQHHDLLPAATSLLPANPQLAESLVNMALLNNATMCKQGGGGGGGGGLHGECNFDANSGFGIPVKKTLKKDRHSKICTAQGVRDRRVRLSIEIAREFFDLQDMLGFDKASKTLEWLLKRSSNAIRELVKMKHGNGGQGLSSSPECETVAENIGELDDGGELEGTSKSRSLEGVVCKEKKMKKLQKATVHVLAKESRAKARARARERTREKMCTRSSTTHEWKRSCPDTSPQFLNNLRSLTQLEVPKKSDHQTCGHNMASSFKVNVAHQVEDACLGHRQLSSAAPRENNVIEESIVIKRKLKPSTILGSQQNLAAAKDVSCSSSGNNYFPNLPQNWDINGAMAHSTFRAITNMNLSTGVQIYGKP